MHLQVRFARVRRTEEEGYSEAKFFTLVPIGEKLSQGVSPGKGLVQAPAAYESHGRKQTSFEETEQQPESEQTPRALDEAQAHANNTPSAGYDRYEAIKLEAFDI